MALRITGANRNESLEAMNLVDDIPAIRGRHWCSWCSLKRESNWDRCK